MSVVREKKLERVKEKLCAKERLWSIKKSVKLSSVRRSDEE